MYGFEYSENCSLPAIRANSMNEHYKNDKKVYN